jgi:hypothetical protein
MMTYADETTADEILKRGNFKIPLYKPIPKKTEPNTEVNDALTRPDGGEELSCDVQPARMPYREIMRKRMEDALKTNERRHLNINQRMLRGFTGFHAELNRYWYQAGVEIKERRLARMAEDNLHNNIQTDASRQNKRDKWKEWKERNASKVRRDDIEEGGRIPTEETNLLEQLSYEVATYDEQSEALASEISDVEQTEEELPAVVESASQRLEHVTVNLTESRSELGPAIVGTPVEGVKTTGSMVNESPANVQVNEELATMQGGVITESILDRSDQSLPNLPFGKASLPNVETNSHSTSSRSK